MQPFFVHQQLRFFRQVIARAGDFVSPFAGAVYPCLVWNHGESMDPSEATQLADALVASNCRYVVTAGTDGDVFHDVVDQAFIRSTSDLDEAARDARFVMTSLHGNEPMDDITFFFALNTSFDDHEFREFLVLHVGGTPVQHAAVEASVRKEVLNAAAL